MSNKNDGASKGLLSSIQDAGKGVKEQNNNAVKEGTSKRSYMLKNSTIKKLQELKVFVYTDPDITYNEIVDEAITELYNLRKSGK
jgi:ABC-type Zn2+ transport system substrate-binding protein/surface adhesin